MAKTNDRVMEFVRREMARDPDARSTALYERAKKVDRSVGRLSLRQFHARYPLQVKRAEKTSGRSGRTERAAPAGKRGRRGGARRAKTAATPGRRPGRPRKNAAPAAAAPAGTASGSREAVRSVLLDFAGSVARAENKADVISLVSGVDGWVDRVLSATG